MTTSDSIGDFDPSTVSRKFTGIWIPREIYLREDISALEKMLWAEIHSLDDDRYGGCYASEKYLCNFLGVERRRFYVMIKELKEAGLLIDVSFNGRVKVRKAILPKEVKNEPTPQQCTKVHPSRAQKDTPTNIYKNKAYNKDIEQKQCANAGTTYPPTEEKIFHSADLEQSDILRGTIKMPQAKWNDYVAQYGKALVERCATELSNYIVKSGKKYKSHYLALNNFIKNALEKEQIQKSKKEKFDFRKPSGIGTASFEPPSLDEYFEKKEAAEKAKLEAQKK